MNKYKETTSKFFDKIAKSYVTTSDGRHSQALYEPVLQKLITFPFSSILDNGCGPGEFLSFISKKKDVALAGVDISPQMMRIAGEKLGEQADIRLGDSEELPWEDNSFDVVVCINAFHHYPNPQKALNEMHRVLKQEGLLILADPWLPSPAIQLTNLLIRLIASRIYGDVRLYSESEIRRLLEEYQFKFIEWERAGSSAHYFNLRPLACVVTARNSK